MSVLLRKWLHIVTVLILLVTHSIAIAWPFGPSNYDECVAKYTRDTESNSAVTMIAYACKLKFTDHVKENYADCVFDNVPGVMSDQAATIVAYACKLKYVENTRIKYANCVLDEVPKVKTDRAATVVAHSCKNRFP